ncbi:MAG: hypothetical protein JWN30_1282, partial [Bacilli bacterium]|nr:hypothetical protein [Bacilli bacterium]
MEKKERSGNRCEGEGFDPVSGSDVDFHSEIFDEDFEDRMNKRMHEIIRAHRNGEKMYLWDDLKPTIKITDTTVECPVKDCDYVVERQRGTFLHEDRFKCPTHQIFISPS